MIKKIYLLLLFALAFVQSGGLRGEQNAYTIIDDQAHIPILTPSLAKRQTLKIRLANGLEAYLISDPFTNQSGAVLTVEAGSWEDPDEYPGLAHFLEHMLFLGTEKYPVEAEYDQFIRAHGGKSNAYTTGDHTLYLFSINHSAFEEALDRFASFFKTPLFNPSGVQREIQAIDQEFSKNLNNDDIRENFVHKELGNPNHPYHRFSAGNSPTLTKASQNLLKEWYHTHYSANLMRLIVYSPYSLEKMKTWVVQDFSHIPNTSHPPFETSQPVFSQEQEGSVVYIEPIRDIRAVRLTWEVPSEIDSKRLFQPEMLVCYVLGHEGQGSLLASLKKDNLAEELGCAGYRLGSQNMLFSIYIKLTEAGLKDIQKVVKRCFEAIQMLKNQPFPRYLFEEVKKIATLRYQFQSQQDPFDYLIKMGGLLVHEDLSTFPEQSLIPQSFDPQLVQSFLGYLTPQRVNLSVLAPKNELPIPLSKKEKWMGVSYETEKLPLKLVEEWSKALTRPDLHLPSPNLFIPRKLALASQREEKEPYSIPRPTTLVDDEKTLIYFDKDLSFLVPQTVWFFEIQSPLIDKRNSSLSVLASLYIRCLKEALQPFSYPASLADLTYEIHQEGQGILMTIEGYSDNAEVLFDQVLKSLKTCRPSEELFNLIKSSLLREYQNFSKENALEIGIEAFYSLLYQNYATSQEKAAALNTVTYLQFLNYLDHLYDQTYVRGLLYGDIEKEQALRLSSKLQTILSSAPFPKEHRLIEKILVLPPDQGPYAIEIAAKAPAHAALLAIEDTLFSFKTRAAQQILSQAMASPFYSTLRTQQQTGYLVYNTAEDFNKHLFSFFAVQSNTHDPRDLLSRFELFIESFLRQMGKEELTRESFETIRQALLERLNKPPQNLIEMGELLKTLAFKYEGDFDWIAKRIHGFKELTYEDFLEIASQFLGKQNKRRVALLVKGQVPSLKNLYYQPLASVKQLKALSHYTSIGTSNDKR